MSELKDFITELQDEADRDVRRVRNWALAVGIFVGFCWGVVANQVVECLR